MLNEPEYLDLIVRYLNNPQDEELHSAVSSFRAKSTEHEKYFLEIEKVWSVSEKSFVLNSNDLKSSVKSFNKSLKLIAKPKNSAWHWIGRVAAIIAIAVAGLWVYKSTDKEEYIVKQTHSNQLDTLALPDGSKIILAENSGVKYSEKFSKEDRTITLTQGQAFFEIARDTKHPFKVKMGQSEVMVLGTSFNIKLSKDNIDLDVKTGKVKFSPYEGGTSSILTKGQGLTYERTLDKLSSRSSQNADAWYTKQLVFVDTPLDEVCKQLSTYFNTTIKLEGKHRSAKKLNATFTNQSLENVLILLNETYNIKIEKQNTQIILSTP